MASVTISFLTLIASVILLLELAIAAPTRTTSPHNRHTRQTSDSVAVNSIEWKLAAAYSIANDYMYKVQIITYYYCMM